MNIQDTIKNILKIVQKVFKNAPIFFAKHLKSVFFVGIFLTLLLGFLIFYIKAYKTVNSTYDSPITTYNINKEFLLEAIKHINEQNFAEPVPLENPFTP